MYTVSLLFSGEIGWPIVSLMSAVYNLMTDLRNRSFPTFRIRFYTHHLVRFPLQSLSGVESFRCGVECQRLKRNNQCDVFFTISDFPPYLRIVHQISALNHTTLSCGTAGKSIGITPNDEDDEFGTWNLSTSSIACGIWIEDRKILFISVAKGDLILKGKYKIWLDDSLKKHYNFYTR